MRGLVVRMTSMVLLAALASCESTGTGGVMDSVLGQVMGTTVGTMASTAAVSTAQRVCGQGSWGMCESMTTTMVAGFSSEFVKRMSQDDVARAADARDESIRSGTPQTWSNPETGASGEVATQLAEPRPPTPTPVKVQKDRVSSEALPMMDAVGEPYLVTSARGANVRGGPGTTFAVVESLAPQAAIDAIAKVRGEDWFMVGRGQVGIGYVSGTLIQPAPKQSAAPAAAPPPPAQVEEVQVNIASECYTTTQKVTLGDGTAEEATVTSCRTPNGWAQV
ncbi:MAG: hypothetical protein HC809_12200 [Gammaproteobacteria bacterium]|nr:hypothetical protein [Gammaproteobacteria bacterium]